MSYGYKAGPLCFVWTGEASEGPPCLVKRGEALGQEAEAAQLLGHGQWHQQPGYGQSVFPLQCNDSSLPHTGVREHQEVGR